MIIRKMFKFENAHIVRDCSSKRCRTSIHGHSYKVEVFLSATHLDNAGMVYDFGLMKKGIKTIIDSFDHATTIYDKDSDEYINAIKAHSQRWVSIPLNPSAEQFSRIFFVFIDALLKLTVMQNAESGVSVYSVIVHETDTGYAQCFRDDAYNENMGVVNLNEIEFSEDVIAEWEDPLMLQKILNGEKFINPKSV